MERYHTDVLVIGAGVVGLAAARELAMAGLKTWVLDKEHSFGMGTSSRNSEVIHAGIYYRPGSAKAFHCVRGKALLYEYATKKQISINRCGKLIVATNEAQRAKLSLIQARAIENGVMDLRLLSQQELINKEPELSGVAGLFSPSTGIIDSHALMESLLFDAEQNGAVFVPNTHARIRLAQTNAFEIELEGQQAIVSCRYLVNAAGLYAPKLIRQAGGFDEAHVPGTTFAKGSYFSYSGKVPFQHLIYPVPEDGGLGVHLTLDLAGSARFGPDVEWMGDLEQAALASFDYAVDPSRQQVFHQSIGAYWPSVELSRLNPDYSGLRPKLKVHGEILEDFMIQGCDTHEINGLVNLFGIESPGLTSCLSIARQVHSQLIS